MVGFSISPRKLYKTGPAAGGYKSPGRGPVRLGYKASSISIPKGGATWMLQIRGFQKAAKAFHFSQLPRYTQEQIYKRALGIAHKILRRAQETCPVDTMRLASSGRVEDKTIPPSGKQGQRINIRVMFGGSTMRVDYALYVHEGHMSPSGSWVRGRPFLARAGRAYRKSLQRLTKIAIEAAWNKYVKQISGYSGAGWTSSQYRMEQGLGPGIGR